MVLEREFRRILGPQMCISSGCFSVGAFFITRAKSNTRYERRYSRPVDKTSGVRCDQTVVLTGAKGRKHYRQPLRRIKYYDTGTKKTFNFLTNHLAVSAPTVAQLYRYRWQVDLFFKWIKQHLRIKSPGQRPERNPSRPPTMSRRSESWHPRSCHAGRRDFAM